MCKKKKKKKKKKVKEAKERGRISDLLLQSVRLGLTTV